MPDLFQGAPGSTTGHLAHPTVYWVLWLEGASWSPHPTPPHPRALVLFHSFVFPKTREEDNSPKVSPQPQPTVSHHQTHVCVPLFRKKRNSLHTIRHFKMELHHLWKPHPSWGSQAAAANATTTGAEKNRGGFPTPVLTDLHQMALISTFHAMIRLPEEACQMPLIMDVILNYSRGMFLPWYAPFISH